MKMVGGASAEYGGDGFPVCVRRECVVQAEERVKDVNGVNGGGN